MNGERLKRWGEGTGLFAFGVYLVGWVISAIQKVSPPPALWLSVLFLGGVAFAVGGVGVVQTGQVSFKGKYGGEMIVRGSSARFIGVGFVVAGLATNIGIGLHAATAIEPMRLMMGTGAFVMSGAGLVILGGLVPTYVKIAHNHGGIPLALFMIVTFGGFGLAVLTMGALGVYVAVLGRPG